MKEILSELHGLIDQKIEEAWASSDASAHLTGLSNGLADLCEKVVHIGSLAEERSKVATSGSTELLSSKFIHYDWMRETKAFLTLWRDILFRYQKGLTLLKEEEVSETSIQYLFELSKEKIEEAATYTKSYADVINKISTDKERHQYLEYQGLRTNPWPLYHEQINAIEAQSHILLDKHEKLSKTADDLKEIESGIKSTAANFKVEIDRIKALGEETIEIVKNNLTTTPTKIIRHIESIESQVLALNVYSSFVSQTDQALSEMITDMEVPKKLVKSQIQYKEINFSHATKQWLEGEIQPLIREAQDVLDNGGNGMRMALTNVKNRVALSIQDYGADSLSHANAEEIYTPIVTSMEMIKDCKNQLIEYISMIDGRLDQQLRVSHIYRDDQNFLDTAQQYIIGQINLDQTAWVQKIRQWILDRAGFARGFMDIVAEEESLSVSEKIVRFVKSRKPQEENHQYNNIFSAEGYIGESFWVGREKELKHALQVINDWKAGYRGSAIISGKRFCGKTVFGELIAHRYFPSKTIRLVPHSTLKVNGRTIDIKADIDVAINFIKKNTVNEKYLVWIDDLELWQSPLVSMSTNVRNLIKHVDGLSAQLFFMVSMSNWFRHHYHQMLKIDKVFQSKINLDFMSEDEVRQAIMIRHGATHKLLVNEKGEKVLPQAFSFMVQKVSRLADHNIGQALNIWSYFTYKHDHDQVIHQPKLNTQLPDFINEENGILLRAILMCKRTNEYRLRKRLGVAFKNKYKAVVQRLINLGVLNRHVDGLLEVNEGIVNDLAALLHSARYIKYKE